MATSTLTAKGIADAAKELGNVDAKTDGPTKANIDEQVTFIDNYITSGVDGILFAANDPVAISPVLKKALSKGINVVGYDANSQPDARQVVHQPVAVQRHRQVAGRQYGQGGRRRRRRRDRHLDLHHAEPGALDRGDGGLCRQVPSQAAVPRTVEAQEDNNLSFSQATTLINKYGDKMKGIFGMTSVATPPRRKR